MNKIVNALGFQAGWWACVAGVGLGLEIESMVFCAALAGVHLYTSPAPGQECKLALLAMLLGIGVDSLLQHLSVIRFDGVSLGPLSPFWLWALWGIFALTLNSALAFLKRQSLILSAILGLVFGPLTYFAGAQLGAATMDAQAIHLLALALAWLLALPLLVVAARRTFPTTQDTP